MTCVHFKVWVGSMSHSGIQKGVSGPTIWNLLQGNIINKIQQSKGPNPRIDDSIDTARYVKSCSPHWSISVESNQSVTLIDDGLFSTRNSHYML